MALYKQNSSENQLKLSGFIVVPDFTGWFCSKVEGIAISLSCIQAAGTGLDN